MRYQSVSIQQLAEQQVRFAPQSVRKDQVQSAEQFLLELDFTRSYEFGDVCEAITSFRPESNSAEELTAETVARDLRLFIEALSDSLNLGPSDYAEQLLTVAEVSQKFQVSAKTVDRWREKGLPSLKIKVDGRRRVMIRESSLNRYAERHSAEIERGRKFRQMTDNERESIISKARELAAKGLGLTEVSRRLGEEHGRATETVRYTLRDYDRSFPENAIYPRVESPVSNEHQSLIYDLHRQGVSVADLARRFRRTSPAVYSILSEVRIRRLKTTPIDFMDSEEFRLDDADATIRSEAPPYDENGKTNKVPSGLPAYLRELYTVPLLNKPQEQHYFRLMNFLKFKASELQADLDVRKLRTKSARRMEALLEEADQIKNLLTRSNLRLVVSIAKRHLKPGVNFFELVSDGNMSLIRAIEKFDYSRGNKFSTYASWAIMKNYARSIPTAHTRSDRFRTGYDEMFDDSTDRRGNPFAEELNNQAQRNAIMEILGELSGRERKVIACRFGLGQGNEPETLEQVGVRLGVTKERVRQIEVRTLEKLRRIADRKQVEIPGI